MGRRSRRSSSCSPTRLRSRRSATTTRPSCRAATGTTRSTTGTRRHAVPGRRVPRDPARRAPVSRSTATRTGSSAATARLFPVSYTSVPIDLPTGRGVVVTFIDLSAQREAEQALRERDAILARVAPAGLGRRPAGALPLREPGGASRRWATTITPSSSASPGTTPSTTSTPTGGRSRRRTAASPRRATRARRMQESRGLAGPQGRIDRADLLLVRAVRPARRPSARSPRGPTSRSSSRRSRPRGSATSPRRARPSCRGAAPDHRGRRRRARARHPRPARRRAAAVRQRGADDADGRATGGLRSRGGRRAARRRRRADAGGDRRPARPRGRHPSRGSSPTAGSAPRSRRSRRGSRCR